MANEQRHNETIALGELNVAVSDHEAPPGTLRLLKDLVWRGPSERPYLSPVETAQPLTDLFEHADTLSLLPTGTRAIHIQVRQRRGVFADLVLDPDQSLERIVAVTDTSIYLIDPGQGYLTRDIYTFPPALAFSKKVQFSQLGDVTYLAVSVGGGPGAPSPVLTLIDDQVIPFNLPDVPFCSITVIGGGDMDVGDYAVRFAWRLKDGTFARPTRPYFVTVGQNDALRFTIVSFKSALDSFWSEIISGVECFLTQKALGTTELRDELMNTPFFAVATISSLATTSTVEFNDKNDNIALTGDDRRYPALDDQNLLHHEIGAASLFVYNQRLLLGDTDNNFAEPDVLRNLVGGSVGVSADSAPIWTATDGSPSLVSCTNEDTITWELEDAADADFIGDVEMVDHFPIPIGFFHWDYWDGAAWQFAGLGYRNLETARPATLKMRVVLDTPLCGTVLDDFSILKVGTVYDLLLRGADENGMVAEVGFQIAVIS